GRRRRHLHRSSPESARGALRRREPVLPRSGLRFRAAARRAARSGQGASRRSLRKPMDLYLDSVDFKEIEAAFDFGFVKGLTTTPTFMHRHGITDIDGAIVKLSGMVPELQVEALGDT